MESKSENVAKSPHLAGPGPLPDRRVGLVSHRPLLVHSLSFVLPPPQRLAFFFVHERNLGPCQLGVQRAGMREGVGVDHDPVNNRPESPRQLSDAEQPPS